MRIVAGAAAAVVAVVAAAVVPAERAVPAVASVPVETTVPGASVAPRPLDQAEVILPMALPVDEAVDEVGLAALQVANPHLDAATVAALAADPMVHADQAGRLYVVDTGWAEPEPGHDHGAQTAALGVQQAPPVADVFTLESRPGSQRTIFLDFDGAVYPSTWWDDSSITALPYDSDGNSSTFGNVERLFVYGVWAAVSEDFAPFDVNVTTKDPGYDALNRTWDDLVFGTVAQIGPKPPAIATQCGSGCLGIAYVGTFDTPWESASYQPAWVFPGSYGSVMTADIVSHEVGHNLGLGHDGKFSSTYYGGHGDWSPIMGNGDGPIDQFSIGDYTGATRDEDDFFVMSMNGLDVLPDDFPDTRAAAVDDNPADLSAFTIEGLIGSRTDVDVVKLTLPAGSVTVTASPAVLQPNLDISLQLLTAAGTVVGTADPASGSLLSRATGMGASVTATLTGGEYYAVIDGVGAGSPLSTGYSDYGSVGRYTLGLGRHRIDVSVVGAGTVSSSPAGISCTNTCSVAMPGSGSQITLTATASAGQSFVRWMGVCSATGGSTCTVDTSQARDVAAVFTGATAPPPGPTSSTSSTSTSSTSSTTTTTTLPPSVVPPGAPSSLRATPGNGQLALTWNAPSRTGDSAITGYEYSLNSGAWSPIPSSVLGARSLGGTISGLVNGTSYRVRVRAVNRAGGGTASSTVYATPSTTPSAPTGVTVTPGKASLTVRFTAAANGGTRVTRYEYSINGGTTWVNRASTATSFTITRLTNGVTYPVQVRAVNARGTGPGSTAVSGTPRTVPGVPTGVVVTPGNGSLAVSWVAPASTGGAAITSYQVSTNGGASWIGVVAPATSTTVTGLVNGRSYRVRVRAVNPAGAGSSTSSVTARPVAS
jgi:hypothetical protein